MQYCLHHPEVDLGSCGHGQYWESLPYCDNFLLSFTAPSPLTQQSDRQRVYSSQPIAAPSCRRSSPEKTSWERGEWILEHQEAWKQRWRQTAHGGSVTMTWDMHSNVHTGHMGAKGGASISRKGRRNSWMERSRKDGSSECLRSDHLSISGPLKEFSFTLCSEYFYSYTGFGRLYCFIGWWEILSLASMTKNIGLEREGMTKVGRILL